MGFDFGQLGALGGGGQKLRNYLKKNQSSLTN